MPRWFLSYHSPDYALAERLKLAIEQKDSDSRVFFAPTHMRAGGFWSAQLAQEIAEATAFILLVGERGIGNWQVLEYDEALDKRVKEDFPLILVLLEGQTAPGLPFLRRVHWITTRDPATDQDVARIIEAASGVAARTAELWRYTLPYCGLAAMEEKDSEYFFGRGGETVEVIDALASTPNELPILLGNSGVGKSSVAQAGVVAAFIRQAYPETANKADLWPQAFANSRRWCTLTLKPGSEPVRALVEPFLNIWQFDAADPRRAELLSTWATKLVAGTVGLRDLLDATELRYKNELHQPSPPAFLVYIDQGEELYTRGEEKERRRFSELLAQGLADSRLYALMSLRADFVGELQKDEPLYGAHRLINVPPLREAALGEVVARPAKLLCARFETDHLAADIARRAAEESTRDAGALPLLSYLLDDMWRGMIQEGDGVLRLPAQSIDLGRVLVARANAFIATHPNSEDTLRRILTLKLATVREDGEPTRRRAWRQEFSDEEWWLITELASHPNRLLVTGTEQDREIYAEVAHEAIFRRWEKLRDWIAAEREFLAWRTGFESARGAWQATPARSKNDALLMGFPLVQARTWFKKRPDDIPQAHREFIAQSRKAVQRRKLRVLAAFGALAAVIIAGFAAYWSEQSLKTFYHWLAHVRGNVLTAERERMLNPGDSFWECAKTNGNYSKYCPEMVVVPAGKFIMGSPAREKGRYEDEGPQHEVTIARRFAVSKFEVTFDQWDACTEYGQCARVGSQWGRGKQPAILVSWDDAQQYVKWLSRLTGQNYRLLTEAEWEYAARAGSTSPYSFEDDASALGEYAWYNENSSGRAHPVGEKKPNAFGLYDIHGNVWEWVEDCYHESYLGSTIDGSPWVTDCARRVARGGSRLSTPPLVRSAIRGRNIPGNRYDYLGIRVGRTLSP